MHRLFHALNEVVPGLGVVMQAAFSPIGASISIAVMALQLFREHLKKVNEELDKMAEENAKPLTNRLEIMRESTIRNATSMAEFNRGSRRHRARIEPWPMMWRWRSGRCKRKRNSRMN